MNDFNSNLSDILNKLSVLFASYKWLIDTIDIIIIAIIVYLIIRFMRESRALHILKGIIVFIIAFFAVNILGMQASSYLFRMVMNNIIIIIIVLFAPEFRLAFESVGRSNITLLRFFGINNEKAINKKRKVINEICKACYDMSGKKIGALIVVERDLRLDDIVQSGTEIDAKVSKELLGSIFFPNSPLHDGAVVIRDDKIFSAGCILPLTQNINISSELGTRHRASIGISEQSDAVIIVVSEETGQISVAHKGSLRRDLSDGDLREILFRYFVPDNKKNSGRQTGKKGDESDERG